VSRETEALLRRRSSLIQQRRALIAQLEAVRATTEPGTADLTRAMLDDIAEAHRELERAALELQRIAPRMAERLVPRTLEPAELQSLLRDDEALYMQSVTRTGTHGVLIRRDRVTYRAGSPRNTRDLVRRSV